MSASRKVFMPTPARCKKKSTIGPIHHYCCKSANSNAHRCVPNSEHAILGVTNQNHQQTKSRRTEPETQSHSLPQYRRFNGKRHKKRVPNFRFSLEFPSVDSPGNQPVSSKSVGSPFKSVTLSHSPESLPLSVVFSRFLQFFDPTWLSPRDLERASCRTEVSFPCPRGRDFPKTPLSGDRRSLFRANRLSFSVTSLTAIHAKTSRRNLKIANRISRSTGTLPQSLAFGKRHRGTGRHAIFQFTRIVSPAR